MQQGCDKIMYYAHIDRERKQTIYEHLTGVAKKSAENSIELMKNLAYTVGFIHDIGKYASAFQERLDGSTIRYEHSSCGAIEIGEVAKSAAERAMAPMLQYCIAGHHTGLPDGGIKTDSADGDITLHSRLKRKAGYTGKSDYSSYKKELSISFPDVTGISGEILKSRDKTECVEKYAFFTRYLFSCLTDADFLDTELFCNPAVSRGMNADFNMIEKALDEKLASFTLDTPLKQARGRLQSQALQNSASSGAISILNMPTGSGKTLCSLKIALQRMRISGKKRVIYVIPYTSIIEQTAETFEKIFGEYADILQHHSNYCPDEDEEDDTVSKMKRSSENWDAPIIITTSVQFFQSLYHYKGSGLRKLHNMADSVIIFDEVHLLPTELLQPCLRGIGYVTKYLNSEAVFLSATMPDYSQLFDKFLSGHAVTELMTDKSDFAFFQKCRYINLGEASYESIIEKAYRYNSSLIIVNSRKAARDVYAMLTGIKYHLSTYMTPNDRSETIKSIRKALAKGEKITVVSTSLVEAGVDLDFEAVFRQLAGLDSILQSGGRCNREGRRNMGDVYIFETDEKPKGDLQVRASIVRDMLRNNENISSEECIEEYYRRLFSFSDKQIEENSIAHKCFDVTGFDNIPFRTYAKDFQFIKEETVGVIINNCDETEKLLSKMEFGGKSVRRKLQRYTVALKIYGEFDKALSLGLLSDTGNGIYVLSNNDYYSSETGLDIDYQPDYIMW